MQLTNQQALDLVRQGAEALQRGHPAEARALLTRVTDTGRANGQIWMLLAAACRAARDWDAEEEALNQLIALDPQTVRGHIMKGDCRARAGDEQSALRFHETALRLAERQQVPPDLTPELNRVQTGLADAYARLDAVREAALVARGIGPDARSPRFQESLDISAGRKQIFPQAPTSYYFPGLAPIRFFDTAAFDWVPGIEAATDAIRAELQALLTAGARDFRPYLKADPNQPRQDDNPLLDSMDWSTLFLAENGAVNHDAVARCPAAWAAVQSAPLPRIANSPTVMFSLLKGGARIAPHTGMFNTRLICHLPLIVPPGCGFRVGNETRAWREGELMIFDDTIEHEAWNDGDRDRVVLIFDIWRPELNVQERRAVDALFSGPQAR